MKGNILSFDKATNKGKISGFDGARYEFVKQDWESDAKKPKVGAEVDFEADERDGKNWARSIVMLSSAQAPTSRTVYILVAIFLGYLGIHNFIAGYKGKGLAQLLITLLSFFILSVFVWIWAVVEAVVIKEDANGQEMT